MARRIGLIFATALALAGVAGTAHAFQSDAAGMLRASGQAGEQADGYLGILDPAASAGLRAQVEAVNARRRAYYADLAAKRGAKIEEVAATTACELFRTKVSEGQYYRLPDGVWRRRDGPIPLPDYCG